MAKFENEEINMRICSNDGAYLNGVAAARRDLAEVGADLTSIERALRHMTEIAIPQLRGVLWTAVAASVLGLALIITACLNR